MNEYLNSIKSDVLVVDLETWSTINGRDININSEFDKYIENAKIKWFGAYSYKHKKGYSFPYNNNTASTAKQLLIDHKIIVGFNIEDFDYPILKNNGLIYENSYHIIVDCMVILGKSIFKTKSGFPYKDRGTLMNYNFKRNSLKYMAQEMGLETQKRDIDYHIFKKDNWTSSEKEEIKKYLKADILATKQMFDKLWDYWKPFTEFLDGKSISNLSWIRNSIASLTYKCSCNIMNVEPTYSEKKTKKEEMGGRVILPKIEEATNVWYVDFGCLNTGEYVHTLNGYKKVEDINISKKHWCYSDRTISQDNNINNFLFKKVKNVNKIYKIYLEDGTILKQTGEHKILTNNGVKQTIDLKTDDKLISPIYTKIKEDKYNDLFELLGIFICEGSLFRKKRFLKDKHHKNGRNSTISQTHLCIKNHEIDFKNQIEKLLKKHVPYKLKFKIRKKTSYDKKYTHLNIYDTRKEIYDWFLNFKTQYYNLEEITKNTGRVKAFLSGVLKSDATWNVKRNTIILNTSDANRASIIYKCFQCLGIHANVCLDKKEYNNRNKVYRFEIYYGSEIKKVLKWFQWNSYRDLKISNINNKKYNKNFCYRNICKIETENGNFTVYDFMMKRQESPYFIHNGVFTHNSMYPHIFCMFNLFSETEEADNDLVWHGNDVFKTRGHYYIGKKHPLTEHVEKCLKQRIELKKNDPKNPMIYCLKIFLNGLYGAVRSSIFEKIHTPNAGWDCCWLGQQIHQLTENMMKDFGFTIIYGDTDSAFLVADKEEYNNKEYVKECLNKVINKINDNVPFPIKTFSIDIEHFIDYIMFPFSEQSIVEKEIRKQLSKKMIEGYKEETIDGEKCIIEEKTNKIVKQGRSWIKERKAKKKNYLYLYKE